MSDPFYNSVILQLPLNGANNGTVFPDYSPASRTISRSGNVVTSTSVSQYYGSSGRFPGTVTDYLSLLNNSIFDFNMVAFTVEAWVNVTATPINDPGGNPIGGILGFHNGTTTNWGLWLYAHPASSTISYLAFETNLAGVSQSRLSNSGLSLPYNTWHHFSVSRDSNGTYLGVNGTIYQRPAITQNVLTNGSQGRVGAHLAYSSWQRPLNGYIQDLRVTRGVARYTSNYTPPPKTLASLSGTVKDNAGANASRTVASFATLAPSRYQWTTSTSGVFSFPSVPNTPHTVLCLDDAAGTLYNDLVYRVDPV